MKATYLVDANLPFRVPKWQNEAFLFVVKINPIGMTRKYGNLQE